jgi:hypothetical protein
LEEILWIEKGGLLKQRVAHLHGAGVKGAGGLQNLALGGGIGWHKCQYNYAKQSHSAYGCQPEYATVSVAFIRE